MKLLQHGNCRSCKAPIFWAENHKGRRIPLDIKSVEDGNLEVVFRGQRPALALQRTEIRWRTVGVKLFKSHFATCPK